MKLPPHLYLEERNIPYEALSFSPETEKGAANVAHALGFSERQTVKTLIFQVDTGERVLVMLRGDHNAISGRFANWMILILPKKRKDDYLLLLNVHTAM